jgi:PAS domain S-box-containing protein
MTSSTRAPAAPAAGAPANLADSAEAFKRLVEGVRDYAIFLLTPTGHIASWNAGAQRIKGWAAHEIIGRHFSTFYERDAIERGWPDEELRRALAAGHFEDEGWRLRKDGTRFWANVVITPVRTVGGELLGFSKVTRDLTERMRAERALQDSERSLRLLIEGVQDYAIFQLDPQGVISSWNQGAERIKGYAAQEAIGRHFSIFYPQEAIDRGWPDEELRLAAERGRFEDEGWRLRKDGSRIWANVVITAIRDERGTLLGYSKVTRDLTERRRHELQVRRSEENLRLLIDGVRDHAIFMLDEAGRIRTWNSGARQVMGWTAGEAIGEDGAMMFPPDEVRSGRPQNRLAAARAAGYFRSEGWRQRADGTRFWAESSITELRDDEGGPRGYVEIVRDLSMQRRVQALEDEGRRISEFIAMLSHELRNPLAPIRNAMAILAHTARDEQSAWCVDVVRRQVDHMSRLIDDLLDLSRVTSGKIRLEVGPIDLAALVQSALEMSRPLLTQHGHAVQTRLPSEPVPVMGDTTRLTQVVANILNNAAKYTPAGGTVQVALSTEGALATLQVTDTGIGMTPELLQQAFEPFVQGERALDRAEGGLGIGLTLVRRIVELHGGTVAASSPGVGQGTTLSVTLPLAPPADAAGDARAGAKAGAGGRRVLVVDDNHDAADTLASLLRLCRHEVAVAYDGAAALDEAARFKPEVVLLDLGLPTLSGFEVARRLRAMPEGAGARLIALTGYGQSGDKAATQAAGFDHHVTKPVDADELLGLLS